jgi:hypothetical protein
MLDPPYFDLVTTVSKLEGDSSYHKWRHHLKVTFGREPPWEVLTGVLQPPSPPKLYKTDREVIRGLLAEKNNIEPHQVTECLLGREFRTLRTEKETLQADYDKQGEEWNQIDSKLWKYFELPFVFFLRVASLRSMRPIRPGASFRMPMDTALFDTPLIMPLLSARWSTLALKTM